MVFGQAPVDLAGVFAQRLRWAMGAQQVGSGAGAWCGVFSASSSRRELQARSFCIDFLCVCCCCNVMPDNPLVHSGLTLVQSLLFWEAAAHHFVAIPTILLTVLPFIFMFTEVGLRLRFGQRLVALAGSMLSNTSWRNKH